MLLSRPIGKPSALLILESTFIDGDALLQSGRMTSSMEKEQAATQLSGSRISPLAGRTRSKGNAWWTWPGWRRNTLTASRISKMPTSWLRLEQRAPRDVSKRHVH